MGEGGSRVDFKLFLFLSPLNFKLFVFLFEGGGEGSTEIRTMFLSLRNGKFGDGPKQKQLFFNSRVKDFVKLKDVTRNLKLL